jgi:hypothetical protein
MLFRNTETGLPIRGDVYALNASGRRQEWKYVIEYFGGDKQNFILPCISLPSSSLTRNNVIERARLSIRQEIRSESYASIQAAKSNIFKVLSKRDEMQSWPEWESFFSGIPASNEIAHSTYINALSLLGHEVGGNIQRKEAHFTTYKR